MQLLRDNLTLWTSDMQEDNQPAGDDDGTRLDGITHTNRHHGNAGGNCLLEAG
jgi:hypothetical protein